MAQNPAVPSPAPVDPMAQQAPVVPPAVPAVPVDPMAQQAPVASVPPVPPIDAAAQPAAAPQPPVAEAEEELEEINLEELLSQLEEEEVVAEELISEKEEGEEEEEDDEENAKKEAVEETVDEVAGLRQELQEHVKVIEYLREQINEINLLNAKLLYTNKLFKQYSLNNSQKLNIVEKFDLATSIREVKYAYTILAESLSSGASTVKKTNTVAKNITEGLASKAVASTKPSKDVIVENTNEMASRFQRLAGIKK
jgi:predicted RNase H-like nuclease (RuvC/YqgF family)